MLSEGLEQNMDSLVPTQLTLKWVLEMSEYPNSGTLGQLLIQTRNYLYGIQLCTSVLSILSENKGKITSGEFETAAVAFSFMLLDLLDRNDQWEDYVLTYHMMEDNIAIFPAWCNGKHFTSQMVHVLAKIERKLERKSSGVIRKSDYHLPPELLSDDDRKTRVRVVLGFHQILSRWRHTRDRGR